MVITNKRTTAFCREILEAAGATIGFADVGSGGPLKAPWKYLPDELVTKFEFEPTDGSSAELPVCISDHVGEEDFHIAYDERASSFHEPCAPFVARFGQEGMMPKKTIRIQCTTLDEIFGSRLDAVDAIDINVEGHDLHVLRGSQRLLTEGFVKLLKVEFELAEAWHGQGRFSDIEAFMRSNSFDLVDLELGFARPVNVAHFYNKGEPIWGKAYFAPSASLWNSCMANVGKDFGEIHLAKAVALYLAAGLPGRAFDAIDGTQNVKFLSPPKLKAEISRVYEWSRLDFGLDHVIRLAEGFARYWRGGA